MEGIMLVGNRMTKHPVTISSEELLSQAKEKMAVGRFRRLPVIDDGKLTGIITDRDLRQHTGGLERTKVNGVMTEKPIAVNLETMLEDAAEIMLRNQIGGLPVLHQGLLVGIITTSDVMKAFLDVMGATESASARIDLIIQGEKHGLVEASQIVSREAGKILSVGTYRETFGANPVCYLRIVSRNAGAIAKALRQSGFDVLGVHETRTDAGMRAAG
jgi:acetoin utilization protein AcuB